MHANIPWIYTRCMVQIVDLIASSMARTVDRAGPLAIIVPTRSSVATNHEHTSCLYSDFLVHDEQHFQMWHV